MMAVDSKQGGTKSAAPGTPGPAATLAGMPALSANGTAKRKRPSSLLAAATSLPSVESSLDEFIAKANETLIDPSSFNSEQVRREEDEKRKEHDALRWKATEQQMRESQAREESLRRQLVGLQGQLAEAEARAAIAGSGGSQDGIIADLKLRLTMADEKIRGSEEKLRLTEVKVGKLEQELATAQSAAASAPAARDSLVGIGDAEAEERVRIAEAKAVKALAAAKAAAAGLTVSQADIAAIETGLAISTLEPTAKKTNWGAIIAAFVVGGAIMFAVGFVMSNKKDKPAASAAGAQPAATQEQAQGTPAPTPAKPTVTPIEDQAAGEAAAQPEQAAADKAAADKAAADKAEADKAAAEKAAAEEADAAKAAEAGAAKAAAAEAAAEKAAAKAGPKAAPKKAATKKAAAPKAAKKAAGGGLADPFGGGDSPAPAPKKAPKAEKKTGGSSGGIVDPF